MKRFFIYIIGVALVLTACDVDGSDNGNLDGFWQMTSREDVFCGTMGKVDMRNSGITWSFQGSILELRDVKKVNQDIIASFERNGDVLKLNRFYFVDRDNGDRMIENTDTTVSAYLMPYGINNANEQLFQIEELTSGKMVLVSRDPYSGRMEFRKY
jgi:hypothetical protein